MLGITFVVFMIMRLAPGGPMEEDLKKLMGSADGKSNRSREESGFSLKPDTLVKLAEDYDRDKSHVWHYLEWLGVVRRDEKRSAALFEGDAPTAEIAVPGTVDTISVNRQGAITSCPDSQKGLWSVRIQTKEDQAKIWKKYVKGPFEMPLITPTRAVIYQRGFHGLLQGKLGKSMSYQEPVATMYAKRMPISIFHGIIEILIIYGICLPLGIIKAIKHKTWIDNASSVIVFAGYAIPGYALGSLVMVYVCAKGYFPMGGFTGENYDTLSFTGKINDLFYHAAMPLLCYLVSAFAMTTMLVKNNLMDHLATDYVRTAVAKGVSFRNAVFKHALRNSLIPLATTIGGLVGIFVSGSMLIEKIFDIDGIGLLQYNALLERDETVTMGGLTISALLLLLGNIISDFAVALVDPKISYE
jgi:microcin C transport system permease protein